MAERVSKKKQAEGIASRVVAAPAASQPTTVRQRMGDVYPSSPARGKEAGAIKAAQTRDAKSMSEVSRTGANPVGSNPLGSQPKLGPTTTSEGLPIGRSAGTTSTRGHGSTAEHVRQLEATANLLGVSTEVSTRGQIRGLSRTSPVVPPFPTRVTNKETGESKQILYTDRTDKGAPVYGGGRVSAGDAERWGKAGRPDLLDVVQQHQNIATPGGINRGPTDKVDTRRGARGEFSGMNPEQLQDAVKAEILPDRINRAVSDLMRPGTFNRARKIQKPWGVGSELTPAQKEKTDTVRVTKGKKTTTMTQAKHQERAEKRIAKRKKAEGGY